MTDTWLVVGLGNPGPRYSGNRHNVGAMVVDELASRTGARLSAHRSRATAAAARLGGLPGVPVVLAVPTAYMNESGGQVKALLSYYDVPAERLVVVHDELDIDAGLVRLKIGGGEGAPPGRRSITKPRATRHPHGGGVGLGPPRGGPPPPDFVLKDFSATERKELPFVLDTAADATELLVTDGLLAAQQRFHAPA